MEQKVPIARGTSEGMPATAEVAGPLSLGLSPSRLQSPLFSASRWDRQVGAPAGCRVPVPHQEASRCISHTDAFSGSWGGSAHAPATCNGQMGDRGLPQSLACSWGWQGQDCGGEHSGVGGCTAEQLRGPSRAV